MNDKTAGECMSLLHQASDKIKSALQVIEKYGVSTDIKNLILDVTVAVRELDQRVETVLKNHIYQEKIKS